MLGAIAKVLEPHGQVVSVYDKTANAYDYYLVPRGVRLRMPKLNRPGHPAFGEALEDLLPSLPRASLFVGRGSTARGRIVMKRRGGGTSLGAVVAMVLDKVEV